jgi:hypothetical protein
MGVLIASLPAQRMTLSQHLVIFAAMTLCWGHENVSLASALKFRLSLFI